MCAEEKIIQKIQNLLDLANNNPNENEAIAAALKAQELMAKYEIEMDQLDNKAETREITKAMYQNTDKHEMKTWKYGLAGIIAKNFRCKVYYAGKNVVFYGFKEDAKIALQVFAYLYEVGNKFAVKCYNDCRKNGESTKGVMNTYLLGFRDGVKSVLEKQCTALMIVIPKEVNDGFEEMTANFKKVSHNISTLGRSNNIYSKGKADGKDMAQARSLTA